MLTTLHVFQVAPAAVPVAVLRMGADRLPLARTPGLRFYKLLGTGRGQTFTLSDGDPLRWGLLGVWSDPAALVSFERRSPVAAGWRRLAVERCRVDLRLLRSRGRWSGAAPFGPASTSAWEGPVAAITRARIRPRKTVTFWRAVPPVSADLRAAAGLCCSLGIGEAPIGLQGTFSLWRSASALADFAYRAAPHRHAIARTATEAWYSEELFARFAVVGVTGTIAGRQPLTPRAVHGGVRAT